MLYSGPDLTRGEVSIKAPSAEEVRRAGCDEDVASDRDEWLAVGESQPDSVYFAVRHQGRLVGHIFLHDRDDNLAEALIGYHLF